MRINEQIKELRKRDKLTQDELAANELLCCNRQKIADWERGKSTPSADDIIALSKIFNVSTDYLLGLTDHPTTNRDIRFVCDYTGLSEKSIDELHTLLEITEYIDLSRKLKSAWIHESIRGYNSVLNYFIENGFFRIIIGLATDYYQGMNLSIEMCSELIPMLIELNELNRDKDRTDIHRFDILHLEEILNNRKEIRLHYYEAQDIIRKFFRNYDKATIEKYNEVTEEYDTVLYEYEKLIEELYGQRLETIEDGEQNGDNQTAQ